MPLIVDESRFPVVVIEVTDSVTDDDVVRLLADGARWLSREVGYATVYVANGVSVPSASRLRRLAAWMKEHRTELEEYHRCAAYVTDSAMLRGFLRALFSFQPIRAQQHVTKDREDAIEFAWTVLSDTAPMPP